MFCGCGLYSAGVLVVRETVSRGLVVLVVVRAGFGLVLATVFGVVFLTAVVVVFGLVVLAAVVEVVFFDDELGERKIPLLLPKSCPLT